MVAGKLKDHQLEKKLGDHARAVVVRRSLFERRIGRSMENLPVQVRCVARLCLSWLSVRLSSLTDTTPLPDCHVLQIHQGYCMYMALGYTGEVGRGWCR